MRSRSSLFALVALVATFALPSAVHAAIPFFGPIIPTAYNVCPASWGLLITVINNIISFLITFLIVFLMPIMIAYGGFLYVINPVNPSKRSEANKIMLNTVLGVVIAMSAWLIVDAIMAVLYHPNDPVLAGTTWSQLITSGGIPPCLSQKGALPGDGLNQNVTGISAGGTLNPPLTGDKSGAACNPASVQAAALAGGYNLSAVQANVFACLAEPESTCGTANINYSWDKPNAQGKASTAAGAFQVLLSSNHTCYENKACQTAAGVTGKLDCQKGFGPNGFTAGGDPKVLEYCKKAAASLDCSASAAACLLQQNKGSFSAWQSDKSNSKQTACINNGGRI